MLSPISLLSTKKTIHVEVCLKPNNLLPEARERCLNEPLREYISHHRPQLGVSITMDQSIQGSSFGYFHLVESLLLECDDKSRNEPLNDGDMNHLKFYIYSPPLRRKELETLEAGDGDSEPVPTCNHWLLPSSNFLGLWENLLYEDGIKEKLFKFALSTLVFSQHGINQHIISCNRLLLLHGPPGTGKTSLCKALAQKLAIRLSHTFRNTHLIEINSHSLFSKWFSESGKLVMRLFAQIHEIIADPQNLVCVLIDEVESLAYARNSMSEQEPKDAMRVVNALLTQLDVIKEYPNVIILATSNLAESIDIAFLDRADIKQYIGLPSEAAIKNIYCSMLHEMMRMGIITKESLSSEDRHEGLITELSKRSLGLSGRTLRKLPVLALSEYSNNAHFHHEEKISLSDFLDAMMLAIKEHQHDQQLIKN